MQLGGGTEIKIKCLLAGRKESKSNVYWEQKNQNRTSTGSKRIKIECLSNGGRYRRFLLRLPLCDEARAQQYSSSSFCFVFGVWCMVWCGLLFLLFSLNYMRYAAFYSHSKLELQTRPADVLTFRCPCHTPNCVVRVGLVRACKMMSYRVSESLCNAAVRLSCSA